MMPRRDPHFRRLDERCNIERIEVSGFSIDGLAGVGRQCFNSWRLTSIGNTLSLKYHLLGIYKALLVLEYEYSILFNYIP